MERATVFRVETAECVATWIQMMACSVTSAAAIPGGWESDAKVRALAIESC